MVKGRDTIENIIYNGEDYWETDIYIIWEEKEFNQLTISRKDGKTPESWYDLWNIKNKIWGEEALAIEIYPRRSNLIDGQNQRHLFKLSVSKKIDFGNASKLTLESHDSIGKALRLYTDLLNHLERELIIEDIYMQSHINKK